MRCLLYPQGQCKKSPYSSAWQLNAVISFAIDAYRNGEEYDFFYDREKEIARSAG